MANEKEKKEAAPAEGAKPEAAKAAKKPTGEKRKKGPAESAQGVRMAPAGETKASPAQMPRLQKHYREKVVPSIIKEFNLKNTMQVPRLQKIVINCAIKDAVGNPKVLDSALDEIMAIAGQKPVLTRAKKAIATFKVREGNAVGVMVTLRKARMWEFLDRLVNVAFPRVRDFKGVNPKSFDGRGNYSVGLREQIIFSEIDYDKVDKVRGMTITVATSSKSNEHARAVLRELGMPFRK